MLVVACRYTPAMIRRNARWRDTDRCLSSSAVQDFLYRCTPELCIYYFVSQYMFFRESLCGGSAQQAFSDCNDSGTCGKNMHQRSSRKPDIY